MTDTLDAFQQIVLRYYQQHGRHDLPWRQPERDGHFDPYNIVVSELMLQQTQVARVIPKYQQFLRTFPTVQALASAPLGEVLTQWSGLGYNRRAKFLWQTAQMVEGRFDGRFPQTVPELVSLPGVGANTAGAIMAYAYNLPVPFLETNIRTVFIHHFFPKADTVADSELLPLVEASIPADASRSWHWALMDYGTHLKQTVGNVSRASKSYNKQSVFQGSKRQIRGRVLRLLTSGAHPLEALQELIADERLPAVLEDLVREQLIDKNNNIYRLRMV